MWTGIPGRKENVLIELKTKCPLFWEYIFYETKHSTNRWSSATFLTNKLGIGSLFASQDFLLAMM